MKRLLITTALVLFVILCVFLIWHFRWTGRDGNAWESIFSGDGRGYFAYFEQIFEKQNFGNAPVDNNMIHEVQGHSLIKYPGGVFILLMPVFGLIKLVSLVFLLKPGVELEYFSKAVSLTSLLCVLLASWALFTLLARSGEKKIWSGLAVPIFFFGSNLMVYSLYHVSISHVYAFFAISFLLLFSYRAIRDNQTFFIMPAAFFLGLVYLIRPLDVVVLAFLPFFFSSRSEFSLFLKKNFGVLLIGLCVFLIVAMIQHLLYYLQCGYPFIWPYRGEGFYWLHPELAGFLLSFRKGMFVYTSLLFIPMLGIFFCRIGWYRRIIVFVFLALLIYMLSSWWCWTYFDSYGMRSMVDFYPVMIVLLATILAQAKRWLRWGILFVVAGLITLNLIQSYQYVKGILHPEYMNAKAYRYLFLKCSDDFVDRVGGAHDLPRYDKFNAQLLYALKSDTSQTDLYDHDSSIVKTFTRTVQHGCVIRIRNDRRLLNAYGSWAQIDFQKMEPDSNAAADALLVISISYPDKTNAYYYTCKLNELPDGPTAIWTASDFSVILPKITHYPFELSFYIWNAGMKRFLVRDLDIRIYGESFRSGNKQKPGAF